MRAQRVHAERESPGQRRKAFKVHIGKRHLRTAQSAAGIVPPTAHLLLLLGNVLTDVAYGSATLAVELDCCGKAQ